MSLQYVNAIEHTLWPEGLRHDVWMIVDAARDRRIFPMLLECHLEYSCLYSGPLHPVMETVAPYLVQLDYDYKDTRRFICESWGNSWGVFFKADAGMHRIRKHLRGLLIVRDQKGSRLAFRYYDPRVLRIYLPTCTPNELTTIFGPIECFWMEDENPGVLLEFRTGEQRLVQTARALPSATAMSGSA
jgi:Domain of unknown function (DUF4123)